MLRFRVGQYVLAPQRSSGQSIQSPRQSHLHRARVVRIPTADSGIPTYEVELPPTGTIATIREDELVDWETYPMCLAQPAAAPNHGSGASQAPLAIAVYRSEMLREGLFSCTFWALGFLEYESRVGTLTKLGRPPDRIVIDWTAPLLFHGGRPSSNAWDQFYEPPPSPSSILSVEDDATTTNGEDACDSRPAGGMRVSAAHIERAAAAGTLGVTTVWGPPYFCKLGNFRGGEPQGFVSEQMGSMGDGDGDDGYDSDADADDERRVDRSSARMPRQLHESRWGGNLDAATVVEGRQAFARWLVVKPAIVARAANAFETLCTAHLPADKWLAVHVRQTDRMYGDAWRFDSRTLVAQIAERAAGLRCGGVLIASDDAQLKAALVEHVRSHAGLQVATFDALLSSTPGMAAHKDPDLERWRNAEDCLVEVLMMAKCAGIVCTLSNVSVAAVFLAPHGYRHYLFCHEGAHVEHEEPSDSDLCMF
jgi:hypothetical protein